MRLPRPYIPLEIRCQVALRQTGEMWPEQTIVDWLSPRGHAEGGLAVLLEIHLGRLAQLLGCEPKDLHLDHDPALGAREKILKKGVHVGYKPDANDPEHLIYREKHAHHIKTQVKGDGAQHPDRVLIKRERRRQRPKKKIKRKWPSRPFPKGHRKISSRAFGRKS